MRRLDSQQSTCSSVSGSSSLDCVVLERCLRGVHAWGWWAPRRELPLQTDSPLPFEGVWGGSRAEKLGGSSVWSGLLVATVADVSHLASHFTCKIVLHQEF